MSNQIPKHWSVLVISNNNIIGNKNGLLCLLSALATALSEGGAVGEFFAPSGVAFEISIKPRDDFEMLEDATNSSELEPILKELINQHSLQEIVMALKRICVTANENNPDFDWNTDADALSAVIERIEN